MANTQTLQTDCNLCHAELQQQRVTRLQEYQGRWYLIEHMPAQVCPQCGAVSYTPTTHDDGLAMLARNPQPLREERLFVLDAQP